ncbi:MAG: RNA polymerase subunit sigma [Candidatus Cloacimonadota bacterium]|nr:MAG: RNA polymerase subunit sigma [Candidatus Cloacimonadota bacterium]
MTTDDIIKKTADKIKKSRYMIAFTGAGISTESGIPPFRGENGIWNQYDPKVLSLEYFKKDPAEAWIFIKEIFYDFLEDTKPNKAHKVLAELERKGILKSITTQNIDGLHEASGSPNVINFHGSTENLVCLKCGEKFPAKNFDSKIPVCPKDKKILKPDFVFFGEGIPQKAYTKAFEEALKADLVLVTGTSGEVMPANMIPYQAKQNGAEIIEINPHESAFTGTITDLYIKSPVSFALEKIINLL